MALSERSPAPSRTNRHQPIVLSRGHEAVERRVIFGLVDETVFISVQDSEEKLNREMGSWDALGDADAAQKVEIVFRNFIKTEFAVFVSGHISPVRQTRSVFSTLPAGSLPRL